jgi:glycosyltransferase involved in cell wall biosynthesis
MTVLDVILRTHDKREIHVSKDLRYCGVDKTTVVKKCVKSLVNSCNQSTHEIRYWWYDDHSSQQTVDELKQIFEDAKHPYTYIPLEEEGWNASGIAQFERGRDSDADLVYFVEDDYLHYPTAIDEMVDAYHTFKKNLGKEISIHPFDDPDNYLPIWIEPCRIVYGKHRHWRTNLHTTFTFLCNPELVRSKWHIFYTLASEYATLWGEMNHINESTMINKLWREEVTLFTPIPSVALHMAYETQRDPYLNWKELWNSMDEKETNEKRS